MQTTSNILMIRPVAFGLNTQTADSNAFQDKQASQDAVQEKAVNEFDDFVAKLRANDINVTVIEDTPKPHTPDSIFPNNWISFHNDGAIFLYPMQAENRRLERRVDLIEQLKANFKIKAIHDLSAAEKEGIYLEGTGSMVLDRENKIAYACLSIRTQETALNQFCKESGYTSVKFHAFDQNGFAIYHTNVMMCVGDKFVVVCLDTVTDEVEKADLITSFHKTGKKIIEISLAQMNQFAGNMLQVNNRDGKSFIIMSERAFLSLNDIQKNILSSFATPLYSSLNTIENNGGGSARCMIAEIHLPALES
ncbi:citrulline utilization hydrolase CtlX [Pedobacter cryophilus]|uniref:Amidinotransferase n=1 Tax=Pedobacter cryophilus TaxID=2571271 RepID=A0A4U1C3L5_9SPHI|nr:arginine deiminase-related protein [Pedobacter cryophilus]TKB97794.1 amidinotransferase [Pedobacter cryophilus]